MKIYTLILVLLMSEFALAGGDSGGTIFNPALAQFAPNDLLINLNINGTNIPGFLRTRTDTPLTHNFSNMSPLIVHSLKYAGETNNSVLLMLNGQDAAVEVMDSEIQYSNELFEGIRTAVRSQQWTQIPKN